MAPPEVVPAGHRVFDFRGVDLVAVLDEVLPGLARRDEPLVLDVTVH